MEMKKVFGIVYENDKGYGFEMVLQKDETFTLNHLKDIGFKNATGAVYLEDIETDDSVIIDTKPKIIGQVPERP